MTTLRERVRRGMMAAMMILVSACSATDATAPAPATPEASASLEAAVTGVLRTVEKTVTAVSWSNVLRSDQTVRATIGKGGGTITIPSTGFTLIVPAGAVSKPTDFSVTAVAGKGVAYEFEPHGTTFARPLTFRQDLRLTAFPWGSKPLGGYFEARTLLDPLTGQATVKEQIKAQVKGSFVEFLINHFSGYLVSCA